MITTTWNALANAVKNLGDFDGLEPVEKDFPVALTPLVDFPGWLEVEVPSDRDEYGFDTAYTLPDGRATSLSDWIPELRDRVPELEEKPLSDREGLAVPVDVLRELDLPPCDHAFADGFNYRMQPMPLSVEEIRYIMSPTDTFRATVAPDWWIEWEDGPHHGHICILCGAQSGELLGVPDCDNKEIREILLRMIGKGWGSESDIKERIFVRVKHNFRDILFYCPVCGWHLQTEAGTWSIGCQHYEIRYPGGLVGYHPPEGTDWEEAGLFEELASPLSREE
jgi:hypothetical protein